MPPTRTPSVPAQLPVEPADPEERPGLEPVPAPPVTQGPWPWAGVGLAAAALFVVIYAVAVLTEVGQQTENLALLGSDFRSEAERERSLERLAPLSALTFAIALVGAVLLGYVRARLVLGLAVASVMVISVVLAEALKGILVRPPLVEGPVWLLRNSFPSGTAAVAAAVGIALILLAPDRLRWLGMLAACALVALVAHALQVSGWHRLSDVVASTVLVVSVGAGAVGALAAAGRATRSDEPAVHPGVYRLVVALAGAALCVGVVMLLLLAVFPTLSAPPGSRRAFHQAAFPLLGAGGCVLLVAAFARLVDGRSLGRLQEDHQRQERPS